MDKCHQPRRGEVCLPPMRQGAVVELPCFTSQSRQRQAERQVRTLSLLFRLEVATIICETREDYLTNKENGEENSWKTQIPKDFR